MNKCKLKPNEALKNATANMNLLPTRKYGRATEEVWNKSHTSEEYKLTYDFKRLKKVDKNSERCTRYDRKTDEKN